jgi:hypothetical protein
MPAHALDEALGDQPSIVNGRELFARCRTRLRRNLILAVDPAQLPVICERFEHSGDVRFVGRMDQYRCVPRIERAAEGRAIYQAAREFADGLIEGNNTSPVNGPDHA